MLAPLAAQRGLRENGPKWLSKFQCCGKWPRLVVNGHGLRTVGGGGGCRLGSCQTPPTHPPTHIRKPFTWIKNEIYQRGPKLEAEIGYTNFWGGL